MFKKEKHTFSTFFFYQKRRKKEEKTVPLKMNHIFNVTDKTIVLVLQITNECYAPYLCLGVMLSVAREVLMVTKCATQSAIIDNGDTSSL